MTVEGREVESEGEDDVSINEYQLQLQLEVDSQSIERKVLGLAARAVCVQCLNLRLMKRPANDRSLFLFRRDSEIRKKISFVVNHKYFTGTVLVLIILNSITLALDSPDNKNNNHLQDFLFSSEIVFVSFFTLEALLKIVALSFYGNKTSYSSNWWNLLDFLIVIVGLANLILPAIGGISTANVSAIRLLRILRPLRTVSRIKGMRAIIQTLILSLPLIGDVFLLLLFLLLVFAIAGIQLWSNSLHRRCYADDTFMELDANETFACSTMATGNTCSFNSVCGVNFDEYSVRYLNFNHMGTALLFVFKIISLDDWPEDMWLVQDTNLHIVWLYFVVLILTSSYFAVNLFLAVLSAIFTDNEATAQVEQLRRGHRMNAVVGLLQGPFKVPEDVELVKQEQNPEANPDWDAKSCESTVEELHNTRKTVLSEGDRNNSKPTIKPKASFNRYNVILRDTGALVLSVPRQTTQLERTRKFLERHLSASPKGTCLKRRSSGTGLLVAKPEPFARQGCLRLLNDGITEVESISSASRKSANGDDSSTASTDEPHTPTLGNNNSLANVPHVFVTGQGITLEVPTSPVRLSQCKSANIFRIPDTAFLNVAQTPRRSSSPAAPGHVVGGVVDGRKQSICPLDEGELNRLPKLAGLGGLHNLGYDEVIVGESPLTTTTVSIEVKDDGFLSPTSPVGILSPSHSSGSELISHIQPCVPLLQLPSKGVAIEDIEQSESDFSEPCEAPHGGVTWRRRRKTMAHSIVAGSIIPPQWEVAEGQSSFMSVEPVMEEPCIAADHEAVLNCRRICLQKGYGGFAILKGKALFREETGEECRSMLIPEQGVIFHMVTIWEEVLDSDAFPSETAHEEAIADIGLEECIHECIKSGYGGFSVQNGIARFKNRSSRHCREALISSPQTRFYIIKGDIGYRIRVRAIVMHPAFEKVFLAVTILNVMALGTDHYGIHDDMVTAIEVINTVCTILFVIEIVMKIVGLGWRLTFRDPYNRFDAFLCLVGIPQLIATYALSNSSGGGGNVLSIFRMLRVARVLRLGRRWVRLRNTIWIVAESISAVAYLSLLLLLILFIYCVLGMQLFGESLSATDSRLTFSSLWRSLLTVFVVVTGEGWVKIMRSTMEATSWSAAFYFVSLFVIGRYIILNLFIAIIIEKFQNKKTDELLNEMEHEEKDWETTVASDTEEVSDGSEAGTEAPKTERRVRSVFELKLQGDSSPKVSQNADQSCDACPDYESEADTVDGPSDTGTASPQDRRESSQSKSSDKDIAVIKPTPSYFGEKTCGCLAHDGAVRMWLTPIVTSTACDRAIVCLIVLNLFLLAAENPKTRKDFSSGFYYADLAFTIVFVVELIAKISVFGIWSAPHAYLKDLWNCVDFVVVLTSLLGLFESTFQLMRSFRVFRLVIRSENAKVVLYATVGSITSVINGLAVCGFLFILFAIMGVQLFKGSFVECSNREIIHKIECNGTFINSLGNMEEARWRSLDYSFDHLGVALFTLFKVALSERWVDIMFVAMDSDNDVIGPEIDKRPVACLYFVLFFIFANFLCLNLIISILISTFSAYHEARFVRIHCEEDQDGLYAGVGVWKADIAKFEMMRHKLLTDGQKKWVRSQQLLVQDIYYRAPPDDPNRRKVYEIVESDKFEWGIAGVIVFNLILLCTQHRVPSSEYVTAFSVLNYIFISVYVLEFGTKVYAYSFATFWKDNWNRFDMIVLLVSLSGVFVGESLTFFRVFRVGRVLRLFHMSKGLAKMFTALLYALPPLFNIGVLLCCVFFVFGVLGVDLYGEIDLDLNPYLNRNFNFRNLGEAILLLFQISTGELWLDALEGVRAEEPFCNKDCGSNVAIPYFIFFMIIVSFLMVNLFVAVVLEAFQDAEQVLSNDSLVAAFHTFRESWLSVTFKLPYDQDEMDVDQFLLFIRGIPPPLGPLFKTDGFLLKLLKDLNIPVDTNLRVRYEHVIHGLARKVFRISHEEALDLSHLSHVRITDEMFTVAHVHCVRKIARIWRDHVEARLAAASGEGQKEESEPAEPEFHPFTAFNVPAEGRFRHRGSDFLGSTYGNSNELGDTFDSNGKLGHKKQSSFIEELHKRSSRNLLAVAGHQVSKNMLRPPSA